MARPMEKLLGMLHGLLVTTMLGFFVLAPANLSYAGDGVINVSSSTQTRLIKIGKSKPKTIRIDKPFSEIVVGDPSIATANPLTDKSFYVVGTEHGTTGIVLYDENDYIVGVLDIEVGTDTGHLNKAIRAALPDTKVQATSSNGRVLLKGKAKNAVEAQRARKIAEQYDQELIDATKVEGSQQVKLEVRFIEAQRQKGKELGVGLRGRGRLNNPEGSIFAANNLNGGTAYDVPALGILSNAVPYGQFITRLIEGGTNVDLLVRALERRGVARRLAEPNLVALSGDKASFLAGGEIPIPVGTEENGITIEYKPFGVGLEFSPTVLDNGLINLKIKPEVSQIDTTNSINAGNGIQIPAIIVRRAETTVELRDGQSFVLAGLLQSNSTYDKDQLPWLGDVPILGALFRSAAYRKNETDLVIIVTPRLVTPLKSGQVAATPFDATAPGNDIDVFANGNLEVSRAHLRKLAMAKAGVLKSGHVLELD